MNYFVGFMHVEGEKKRFDTLPDALMYASKRCSGVPLGIWSNNEIEFITYEGIIFSRGYKHEYEPDWHPGNHIHK